MASSTDPQPTTRRYTAAELRKLPAAERDAILSAAAALAEQEYLNNSSMNEIKSLDRITFDPNVMGGKACLRGLRVTVGMVVGLFASGKSREEILKSYPYLESADIDQALAYAAWRVEERDLPLTIT